MSFRDGRDILCVLFRVDDVKEHFCLFACLLVLAGGAWRRQVGKSRVLREKRRLLRVRALEATCTVCMLTRFNTILRARESGISGLRHRWNGAPELRGNTRSRADRSVRWPGRL
eukprot:scaffold54967_cov45-Attheya_sp.AAC.3